MSARATVVRVAAGAALALALAACTSDSVGEVGTGAGEAPAPWLDPDASWMLGEGTSIARGISVPPPVPGFRDPFSFLPEQEAEAYGVTFADWSAVRRRRALPSGC